MNAYFTCVFGKNSLGYAKGASILAQSLRMCQVKYPICCMITTDIPIEAYELLERVFDELHIISYIKCDISTNLSSKQKDIYSSWMGKSFTKWTIMKFTQYDKICFLDSDLVITRNLDHVFNYAPSSVFANIWFEKNGVPEEFQMDYIPPETIMNMLNSSGFVINGHFVVLETSMKDYMDFKKMLSKMSPFGFSSHSIVDEQSISYFQSVIRGRSWKVYRHDYNMILWHADWIKSIMPNPIMPYVIHYAVGTKKIWDMSRNEWKDAEIWWGVADELVGRDNLISILIPTNGEKKKWCPYCITMGYPYNHLFIADGKFACPLMTLPM